LTARIGGGMPAIVPALSAPAADDPLPTFEGRACNFGLVLDAAAILDPARAGATDCDARRALFATVDPELARSLASGDVIVAEAIVGTADDALPALSALATAGVHVLVAASFAPDVRAACAACGLAAVVVDTPSCLHTHDRLRLDFDAEKIVNLSSGDRIPMRNLDEAARRALRSALTHPHA
jgi:3-isopropylmalate dehydratase small subunit